MVLQIVLRKIIGIGDTKYHIHCSVCDIENNGVLLETCDVRGLNHLIGQLSWVHARQFSLHNLMRPFLDFFINQHIQK